MTTACRWCGETTREVFRLRVLENYDVGYAECRGCGSLQTDPPFWLGEAYPASDTDGATSNLNNLDTGAAQRNLTNLAATVAVARLLKCGDILDVGGGDGLLCRLLRDHGLNAFVSDEYARPTYAQGFTEADFVTPDLMTAFEVFEHFAAPATDVATIFAHSPRVVLATTTRYTGQGPDWPYLIPATGQHVFFYSPAAIAAMARRFGYRVVAQNDFAAFVPPGTGNGVCAALRHILRPRVLRYHGALLQLRPATGYIADAAIIAQRSGRPAAHTRRERPR